jgi:hypothetical protein
MQWTKISEKDAYKLVAMLARVSEWLTEWKLVGNNSNNAINFDILFSIKLYILLFTFTRHVGLKGHNYYVHSLILGMWAQTSSVFVKGIYNTRQVFSTKYHFNIHDVKNYTICTTTRELSVIIFYNQKDWLCCNKLPYDKDSLDKSLQKAYLGYNNNSGQQMQF